jgi:hypothetical protein
MKKSSGASGNYCLLTLATQRKKHESSMKKDQQASCKYHMASQEFRYEKSMTIRRFEILPAAMG